MDGWTVKLLAGLTLTLAGAAAGRVTAQVKKRRAEQLKAVCQATDRLAVSMFDRNMPLARALQNAGYEGFKEVSRIMEKGFSAQEAWKESLLTLRAGSGSLCALEDEDIDVITSTFERLGKTGLAEQRLLIANSREAIDILYEKARRKADEQGKLYSTLGLLAGLAVSILLI